MRQPRLTAEQVSAFIDEVFPQQVGVYRVDSVSPNAAVLSQAIAESHLRPGGTVSGPTMFALADCAFYVAVLAMIGREALTVTTTLTINFLRKPPAADMRAEASSSSWAACWRPAT